MNPKMESGRKLIIFVALAAAVGIGAGVFWWARSSPGSPEKIVVEGMIRKGHPEFEKYSKMVGVTQNRATLARNYMNRRVVSVTGTIYNRADQWLEAVEITVSLLGPDERPVLSQKRVPVAPGSHGKPIAPKSEAAFATWVEQIPDDWSAGRTSVEVTGFKLAGSSP